VRCKPGQGRQRRQPIETGDGLPRSSDRGEGAASGWRPCRSIDGQSPGSCRPERPSRRLAIATACAQGDVEAHKANGAKPPTKLPSSPASSTRLKPTCWPALRNRNVCDFCVVQACTDQANTNLQNLGARGASTGSWSVELSPHSIARGSVSRVRQSGHHTPVNRIIAIEPARSRDNRLTSGQCNDRIQSSPQAVPAISASWRMGSFQDTA